MSRRRSKHPVLANVPQGVWCPDAVGKVQGYPRTLEEYERRCERLRANHKRAKASGRMTREGIPNGWAGKREEVAIARRNAVHASEMLMATEWDTEGELEGSLAKELAAGLADLCPRAREAMTVAIEIALSPTETAANRLSALRLMLDFTIAKPTRKALLVTEDPLAVLTRLAERPVRRSAEAIEGAIEEATDE